MGIYNVYGKNTSIVADIVTKENSWKELCNKKDKSNAKVQVHLEMHFLKQR